MTKEQITKTRASTVDISRLDNTIKKAREHLLGLQNEAGYWSGELQADASVTAGYIPLMYFMTGGVDKERQRKVVNFVRSRQREDGSWGSYHDGPGDINVTIQVYFALKLAGISAVEPAMQRARDFILGRGGISRADTLTRIWLALFGQFDWRGTPSLPPEIILLPKRFYFNIYEFASWSRETIVALMLLLAQKPVCPVPGYASVAELYVEPEGQRDFSPGKIESLFGWRSFFLYLDRLFKIWEKLPFKPGRRLALRQVERWVLEHQEADGSWGGIMLPWVYSLMALKSRGYPLHHPAIARGLAGLGGVIAEDASTLRLQPATSPVWDTAWSLIALRQSGLPASHPSVVDAARWLLKQEIRTGGDWLVKNPKTAPGAWAFEFANDLYPDIDDTAVVARALLEARLSEAEEKQKADAIRRGLRWVADMQSNNGGWAAFDRNNNKRFLAFIPFADFMTPLDPTSPDVTAHAIELFGAVNGSAQSLDRAISYLKNEQESDGAWYGRWGVNYIYGTGLVLAGLRAAGQDMSQAYIRRAVAWLLACQNPDGGWGETCRTYDDPDCRGAGPSTASQTAWALLGFLAAGEQANPAAARGISYLVRYQGPDGDWQEDAYTGTGFPRAFYLRYDLYRIYFPLLVLAQYKALLKGGKQ